MEGNITFPIIDKYYYFPVKLNILSSISSAGNVLDSFSLDTSLLLNDEEFDKDGYYLLDFTDCDRDNNDLNADKISSLLSRKYILICKNEIAKLIENISTNYSEKKFDDGSTIMFCSSTVLKTVDDFSSKLISLCGKRDFHQFIISQIICNFYYDDLENNKEYSFTSGKYKYIESSNIYVNKYIDIKSLFLNLKYAKLVVNQMKNLVKKIASRDEEVSLLGVSNTGEVLANLLKIEMSEFKIKVETLNRIGPVYCFHEDSRKLKKLAKKKIILISDVICMGGEYRVAKGILDTLGANLLGGVCVIKIRDIYRGKDKHEKVYSVVDDFSQGLITGNSIDYKLFCDD